MTEPCPICPAARWCAWCNDDVISDMLAKGDWSRDGSLLSALNHVVAERDYWRAQALELLKEYR